MNRGVLQSLRVGDDDSTVTTTPTLHNEDLVLVLEPIRDRQFRGTPDDVFATPSLGTFGQGYDLFPSGVA